MAVKLITNWSDVAALHLPWRALWGETRQASFFQTKAWFEIFGRYVDCQARPFVIAVYDGGRICGLLPLVKIEEPALFGSIRVLTLPDVPWANFLGPVGGQPTATLLKSLRMLDEYSDHWDLLRLPGINRLEVDRRRSLWSLQQQGWHVAERVTSRLQKSDLSRFDSAAPPAPNRTRVPGFEQRIRQLVSDRSAEYLCIQPDGASAGDDEPAWKWFDRCWHVASHTTRLGPWGCPAWYPTMRACHLAAARQGACRLDVVQSDGQPLAFLYHLMGRDHLQRLAEWAAPGETARLIALSHHVTRQAARSGLTQCWLGSTQRTDTETTIPRYEYVSHRGASPRVIWHRFRSLAKW